MTDLSPATRQRVTTVLRTQRIETPSWAFANSGTRFKVFGQPGVPRTAYEKIDDAATVHRFTGVAPSVALHIPWDAVDDYRKLSDHAAGQGIALGTINSNVFQDPDHMLGSVTDPPGPAGAAQGHRPPAGVRRHHGRHRLAGPETVVLRRHALRAAQQAGDVLGANADIIYIASKNAVVAGPDNVAYGAAKADQAHQVRLLAVELAEHGTRVNGTNPDAVVRGSGIFAGGWAAQRAAAYIPEQQLGAHYAARTLLKREVLLAAAARAPALAAAVDAGDQEFLAPGDMPARIAAACRRSGQPAPADPRRWCAASWTAWRWPTGPRCGSCRTCPAGTSTWCPGRRRGPEHPALQLTADACQLPVVAGPVEATATGNALVQARAHRVIGADLAAMREVVRRSVPLVRYQPTGDGAVWQRAAARLTG